MRVHIDFVSCQVHGAEREGNPPIEAQFARGAEWSPLRLTVEQTRTWMEQRLSRLTVEWNSPTEPRVEQASPLRLASDSHLLFVICLLFFTGRRSRFADNYRDFLSRRESGILQQLTGCQLPSI